MIAHAPDLARTDGEGEIDRYCFKQPRLLYPRLVEREDQISVDSDILRNWSRKTIAGAWDFRSVDVGANGSGVVDYSIWFNQTLTEGSEVPILMNMVTNALWRLVMGSTSTSQYTNVGSMNFPSSRVRNGFDIISLGGRT